MKCFLGKGKSKKKNIENSSKANKVKTNKNKSALIFHILMGIFLVYSISTLFSQQFEINSKVAENESLNEQIKEQKIKNEELKEMVSSENRDTYYAQIARESLNYVSMGERVFVDISSI